MFSYNKKILSYKKIGILVIIYILYLLFEYKIKLSSNIDVMRINKQRYNETIPLSDDDCKNNLQWEILEEFIFFKRSASYYFKDKQYILLHFFTHYKETFNMRLIVNVIHNDKIIHKVILDNSKYYRYKVYGNNGFYDLYDVRSEFNLFQILERLKLESEIGRINLQVIIESDSGKTEIPIDLKIKNLRESYFSKDHSMICSRTLVLSNAELKSLKWWFELNKKMGLTKIVIYNNSIENSVEYKKIFQDYEHFVELKQMQCLPNFYDNRKERKYLRHVYDLKWNNQVSFEFRWVLDVLLFNECYLDHIDHFNYISLIDPDELILPRKLKSFNPINAYNQNLLNVENILEKNSECVSNPDDFQDYIEGLVTKLSLSQIDSLHVKMGYYLKRIDESKIFEAIDKYIASNSIDTQINVVSVEANYTFQVMNENDRSYLIYLNNAYKKVLKFISHNNSSLVNLPEMFNRLFLIYGEIVKSHQGKSIQNTNSASELGHHTSFKEGEKHVSYEYGHVSHFRPSYRFNPEPIRITDLVFDLNYFQCFFVDNIKMFD